MKKGCLFLATILFTIIASGINNSYAVNLEAGDWKFGINGFLDGVYTYTSEMPTVIPLGVFGTTIGKWEERSFFNQEHLNLLFGAERGNVRVNINLQSLNAYSSGAVNPNGSVTSGRTGQIEFLEAYGIYSFHDLFKVQAGQMLAPFGIYNDVRYITPLFATVVLPEMYQMPPNYLSGDESSQFRSFDLSVPNNLMPTNANLMLLGNYSGDNVGIEYYFYVSSGERGADGTDVNKNTGVGLRFKTTILEGYKFGFSYYSVDNNDNDFAFNDRIGKEHLMGFDVEINLFNDLLKIEGEYVEDRFKIRLDRRSHYVRLTSYVNKFSPFISYDFVKDKASVLFKRGQKRYGGGSSYRLSSFVTVKAEYYRHIIEDPNLDSPLPPALPPGTDKIDIFRSSMIFVF